MMAALVVLTGRLPGYAEPGSNLGPPDAQADSLLDQLREFCFGLPLRGTGALNPLQYLKGRHPGIPLRLPWRPRRRLLPAF